MLPACLWLPPPKKTRVSFVGGSMLDSLGVLRLWLLLSPHNPLSSTYPSQHRTPGRRPHQHGLPRPSIRACIHWAVLPPPPGPFTSALSADAALEQIYAMRQLLASMKDEENQLRSNLGIFKIDQPASKDLQKLERVGLAPFSSLRNEEETWRKPRGRSLPLPRAGGDQRAFAV